MLLEFIDSLTTHNFTGIDGFKFYGQTSEIGNLSTSTLFCKQISIKVFHPFILVHQRYKITI